MALAAADRAAPKGGRYLTNSIAVLMLPRSMSSQGAASRLVHPEIAAKEAAACDWSGSIATFWGEHHRWRWAGWINGDDLLEHIQPEAWNQQRRELAAALSLLPEAFAADEGSLEHVIVGSDPEANRSLARLSDRLPAMALWREQKDADAAHRCHSLQ